MAADDDIPIIGAKTPIKGVPMSFQCATCHNENTYVLTDIDWVNKYGYSQIMFIHMAPHECPFCHQKYIPFIPEALPPVSFKPVDNPGGLVNPHQVSPFRKQ